MADSHVHSSAVLISRPYAGLNDLFNALDMTKLHLSGEDFEPGSVSVPADSLPFSAGHIEVCFQQNMLLTQIQESGLDPSKVNIACVAYGSVIADSAILIDKSITELISPTRIELAGAPLIFKSPNGFAVRVFLYLAEEIPPKNLRPHRAGTWLAYEEFRVAPFSSSSRFCPTPLSDELRRQMALSPESISYVMVTDGLLESDSLDEEVIVYLDSDVIQLLNEGEGHLLVDFLQRGLAVQTLVTVVNKAISLLNEYGGFDQIDALLNEKRPIASIIYNLAEVAKLPSTKFLDRACEDLGFLTSCVEALLGSLKSTTLGLKALS